MKPPPAPPDDKEESDDSDNETKNEEEKPSKGGDKDSIDNMGGINVDDVIPVEYDPLKHWRVDGLAIFNGKRRFGKTTAMYSIFSKVWQYYSKVYVFSKTAFNGFWQRACPKARIYPDVDFEIVKKILEEQKEEVEDAQKWGEWDGLPFCLIVFDDVISATHALLYDETFLKLAFEGRHFKICIVIATQDIKGVPPRFRQNVDQIFMTYTIQKRQVETLQADFADFPWAKRDDFMQLLLRNTHDFKMLVIDQAEARRKLSEIFYCYTADPNPKPFQMGDDEFWEDSGCNWEQQQEEQINIQKIQFTAVPGDPALEKLTKQHWGIQKEHADQRRHEEYDEFGTRIMKTSSIWAASPARVQQYLEKERQKQEQTAAKKVQAHLDFLYRMYKPAPPIKKKLVKQKK